MSAAEIKQPEWAREVEPTTVGAFGRAWLCVPPEELRDDWRQAAHIGTWIVHAPYAHPFWGWYAVMMIALRDVEGQERPAVKQFADAAYEVMIYAHNPEVAPPHPHRAGGEEHFSFLSPVNQVVQIIDPGGDDKAREILGLIVKRPSATASSTRSRAPTTATSAASFG